MNTWQIVTNCYRLVPVDLIRQKNIRCWSKNYSADKTYCTIKKNLDDNGNATDTGNGQNVFVLTTVIKSKKRDLNCPKQVKLRKAQLHKFKFEAKKKKSGKKH